MPSLPSDEEPRIPVDPDLGGFEAACRIPAPPDTGRPSRSPGSRPGARRAHVATLAALAVGGAFGAVARYAVSLAIPAGSGQFPWATLAINVSGSLTLGFLLVVLMERLPNSGLARMTLGTGFVGAYTTFSTFMVEAVQLVRHDRPGLAVAYLVTSTMAGLAAAWLGTWGARTALGAPGRSERALR